MDWKMKRVNENTIDYWAIKNNNKIKSRDIIWAIKWLFHINLEEEASEYILISPQMFSYIESRILNFRTYRNKLQPNLHYTIEVFDLIFLDTCFAVNCAENNFVLLDRIIKLAVKGNKKIIVPEKVFQELDEISTKNFENMNDILAARRYLNIQFQAGNIRTISYCNSFHADQFFIETFTQKRVFQSILVLTDDKGFMNFVKSCNTKVFESSRGYLACVIKSNNTFEDLNPYEVDSEYSLYLENPYCLRCGKPISAKDVMNNNSFCRDCWIYLTSEHGVACENCGNKYYVSNAEYEEAYWREDLKKDIDKTFIKCECIKCKRKKTCL